MRTPSPNNDTGKLLFHGGGRQGFNILVAPVVGSSFTLTEDDIYSGGFLYNAASTSSQTIELGSVFASQLCLSLIDMNDTYTGINFANAKLTVSITASHNGTDYTVPFGTFYVDEVNRRYKQIDLVALDSFVKFDKQYMSSDYTLPDNSSLYDVISWICSSCGVTFATQRANLTNADFVVKSAPVGGNVTYRQLLSWAAQITGCCAKFKASNNTLEFVWYDSTNPYSFTADDTFSHSFSPDAITITGIEVKQGGSTRYVRGNLDYPLTIEENGFITSDVDFAQALVNIGNKVIGTTYYPYSASKINDALLEPFDAISYTNSEGTVINTFVTNVNYAFADATGISATGESATNKGYASGSPFTEEQQAIIGNLQDKVKIIRSINDPIWVMNNVPIDDNGLNRITNGYWHYSTDMSKILQTSFTGTYTIKIDSPNFNAETFLTFSTANKCFSRYVTTSTVSALSDFVSQSPSVRQAAGQTTSISASLPLVTAFLIRIDTTNGNWSVVANKDLTGAKIKIYKNNVIVVEEYLDNSSINVDAEPTEDSDNFVSSGTVYESLTNKQNTLTYDDTPSADSNNPVTSDGIYRALQDKQDELTFDDEPTSDSSNPVTSDGIYQSLQAKQDTLEFDTTPTSGSTNPVTSGGIRTALNGKQNTLTFDNTPTSGSSNPVKSSGIASALSGKMDNPAPTTASGQIPVMRSSGVEWMFDSSFYGTFAAEANDDLNADKFWADRARFYMSSESTTHIVNRPNNTGGLCFVITLGGLGASWKYQVYMTRNNNCDTYVRYRSGTGTPQAWKHISMT